MQKLSVWKKCLSELNHFNKITVITVMKFLLIPLFINEAFTNLLSCDLAHAIKSF